MPKPLLINRPSGLYVRFFVPVGLQAGVGSTYLVRSLQGVRANAARLMAAAFRYVLLRGAIGPDEAQEALSFSLCRGAPDPRPGTGWLRLRPILDEFHRIAESGRRRPKRALACCLRHGIIILSAFRVIRESEGASFASAETKHTRSATGTIPIGFPEYSP